jgi:hypothetical protein
VKELWEERITIELNRQLAVSIEDTHIPVGEVVSIELISADRPVQRVPEFSWDSTKRFTTGDTLTTKFKITCVSRRASDGIH